MGYRQINDGLEEVSRAVRLAIQSRDDIAYAEAMAWDATLTWNATRSYFDQRPAWMARQKALAWAAHAERLRQEKAEP